MTWMWMSFIDRDADPQRHLGCCMVEIDDLIAGMGGLPAAAACVRESRARGCNPGGEVMMHGLVVIPPEAHRNRLIPPDEARILTEAMADWPKVEG